MEKPLAEKMRPMSLRDVVGQQHILGKDKLIPRLLKSGKPFSLIFWGPPGSGKTTLARIIANELKADFVELSAVNAKKADITSVINKAQENQKYNRQTVLFVDEIHRFNKAQQDGFLPHVENGLITLIGATTENPSFEVIRPLLSRSRVLVLEPLSKADVVTILKRAAKAEKLTLWLDEVATDMLAELSGGDARVALSNLELAAKITSKKINPDAVLSAAQKRIPGYDKAGEMHYNVISAFIKSMRGSNVTATFYWLARMLKAGEDPKFIARRMVIFASEDIGLAAPAALNLAISAFLAVERIGLPECQYNLFHCAAVLAKTPKSRDVSDAMNKALNLADEYPGLSVPLHLRNAPTQLTKSLGYGKGYKWRSGFEHNEGYLPDEISDLKIL
jgi:putative ATPase